MSNCLFSTLFLLLVCSTFCVPSTYADDLGANTAATKNVELFKKDCDIKFAPGGCIADSGDDQVKIENVDNVFFVTAGDLLFAVAEAQYPKNGDVGKKAYNFVAANLEKTDNLVVESFKQKFDICKNCKIQLATNTESAEGFFIAKSIVYDSEKNKIYLLAVNNTSTNDKLEYYLFVGDVPKGISAAAPITWGKNADKRALEFSEINNFKNKLRSTKEIIGSSSTDSGAFVSKDKKVVFFFRAKDDKNKYATVFVGLKGDPSKPELNVLHVEDTAENCYPYLFLWYEKIVMITTNCTAVEYKDNVKTFTDITHWGESSGPFYYLTEFLKDKTSFTTAVIGDTNVLLFAQKKEKEGDCTDKKCFTFWFSDGNRTYNVGENVVLNKDVVSGGIIYANKNLLFLHQESESNKKFTLTLLEEQLENITKTIDIWNKAGGVVSNLCATESSKTICAAPLPTEGLVGFLSKKHEDTNNKWIDEYLYVNADITQGTNFNNGLKCNGKAQGAKWQVGKEKKDQPYNFAKSGFTLLVMVTIDGNVANKDNSVLGLALNGDTNKRIELWCGRDKKWTVCDDEKKELKDSKLECQKEKTYIIAVVLKGTEFSVYVNWEKLTVFKKKIEATESINYFYFGVDIERERSQSTDDESHVTITNVLLYNRPLENAIDLLKPLKSKEEIVQTHNEGSKIPEPAKSASTTETDAPADTPATKNEDEMQSSPSPPPTTEDSAVRVGVVGVLCFMLFGVFTLLGRYVY